MIKMSVCTAVVAGCLIASPAFAQSDVDSFSKLSPGNQKIAEAMFLNQKVSTGDNALAENQNALTENQIAALKTDSGWGKVFQMLKAKGYFPDYKNLGQLISAQQHLANEARKSGATSDETSSTGSKSFRPEQASKGLDRTDKIERTAKIDRPDKVERPEKPDRPERVERPQRPDRPDRPERP